jgi:hypothetical protein
MAKHRITKKQRAALAKGRAKLKRMRRQKKKKKC